MEKPLAYGEVGGDWYPENEISINIEKLVEKKEMYTYNTSIYNLLKEQDDDEIKEKDNWSDDEEIKEEDNWSDFPNCKDAIKYKLASYCPMTGKELFKKIKPDSSEQVEVDEFAVYQSDGEEEIQASEAEYDVDSYAIMKE